jgi:hypothetical protein
VVNSGRATAVPKTTSTATTISTMEDLNFTVTLPSNSNMTSNPTNRGNNYVVKLSSPLNFTGQTLNEDTSWEVALTTMQYTNRFYDLRENCTLYIAIEVYLQSAINTAVDRPKKVTELPIRFTDAHLTDMSDIEKRILKSVLVTTHKAKGSRTITSYLYGKILVPVGDYKNPLLVVQNVISSFDSMFGGTRYSMNMGLAVDGDTGRITLRIDHLNCGLYMFTESPSLVHTFGLPPTAVDKLEPPVYSLDVVGTKTPRFDKVHSLYVYSDIVKEQRVGDTMAPLLEIVPVRGVPGNRVHYSVNPLTYLPVNRDYIDTINVVVMDEYGKPVVFPDDVENVVCRLRFRRVRQHWPQM